MIDYERFAYIARTELLIEQCGIVSAADALLNALKNVEADKLFKDSEFKNTQEYRDIQKQKQILNFAATAIKEIEHEEVIA